MTKNTELATRDAGSYAVPRTPAERDQLRRDRHRDVLKLKKAHAQARHVRAADDVA